MIEQFQYNDYRVEIYIDEEPECPRAYENLTTLACWHPKYKLGDNQIVCMTQEALRRQVKDIVVVLPLYLHDHGARTMNTTGFSDRWDSGQVGWGYITKESAEAMGIKGIEAQESKLLEYLVDEVATYNRYLRGEVHGYKIFNAANEEVEACWGFLAGLEQVRQEARDIIDGWINKGDRA